MKRFLCLTVAILSLFTLFVGCSANEVENSQTESVQASETASETISETIEESSEAVIDETSEPEAESSIEDKFAGIASFDTEFNEANVHYYDDYMTYEYHTTVTLTFLYERHSHETRFDAYENASDDDWFVVAISCNDDVIEVAEHIGAIEIPDHPFSKLYERYKIIQDEVSAEERQALYEELYSSLFPDANYQEDPNPMSWIPHYTYVGYFTKSMLYELGRATSGTSSVYTFLPEIGNNECWFKNLRKS